MNLVDLFTVLPFFCELALSAMGIDNTERLKDLAGKKFLINCHFIVASNSRQVPCW
jgi:hypothetical protein